MHAREATVEHATAPDGKEQAHHETAAAWRAGGVGDTLTRVLTSVINWIESMLAGALAGAMAKTVIAPGDRVKIIFQADAHRKFSIAAALKVAQKIIEASGWKGLWTGHTATLLRIMPYAATSYTSFDYYKAALEAACSVTPATPAQSANAIAARFFAGACAGATATLIVYPLDLMRARYAAHWDTTKRYPSYFTAARSIVHDEGWRALYSGLTPTLMGIIPYSGITYCVYETLAGMLASMLEVENVKALPPYAGFACGSFAGLVGQSATYPLDIVRRRMQVHPRRYTSMSQTLVTVAREEGIVAGLFKGLSMNWIKGPISVGISFASRDYFKSRIRDYHEMCSVGPDTAAQLAAPGTSPARGLTVSERVACGGVAGMLAKLWTMPFDRLRIMFAVGRVTSDDLHGSGSTHVLRTIRELMADSPHMWQGSGAMMVRVMPYAAICYSSFSGYQHIAQRVTYASTPAQQPISNFLAGAMAATTATVALYPFDLLHARAAAGDMSSASYLHELRNMRAEGARSLFKGLSATVMGIAPAAGLSFALYHEGVRRVESDAFLTHFAVGTASGAVSQLMTYPLNVVRRTMQLEAVEAGVVQNLARIYRHDGLFSGLYRRMPLGWVLSPTTVGLSFATYDATCRSMHDVRALNRRLHADLVRTSGAPLDPPD